MRLTTLLRPAFRGRPKAIDRFATDAEQIQRRVLASLLRRAARTEWGQRFDYAAISDYEAFAARVPLNTY